MKERSSSRPILGSRSQRTGESTAVEVGADPPDPIDPLSQIDAMTPSSLVEASPGRIGSHDESSPRVSIVIPCYNTAPYMAETLDSLFAQTFTNYEAIVVNDGSPDTAALEYVLEPYCDRIRYIVQENRGLAGARNTAIRAARGEFVALLDSDDRWHPEYLSTLVAELDSRPDMDVVFPDALIFGDAPEAGRSMMESTPLEGEITFDRLLRQDCFVFVGVVARREVLLAAGLFDESFRSSEDYDLWLRLLRSGRRIGYVTEVLAYYRRRGDSLSANLDRMFQHHLMVWEKVDKTMALSPAEHGLLENLRATTIAKRALAQGRAAFLQQNFCEARERISEANDTFDSRKLRLVLLALRAAPRVLLSAYRIRERFS